MYEEDAQGNWRTIENIKHLYVQCVNPSCYHFSNVFPQEHVTSIGGGAFLGECVGP